MGVSGFWGSDEEPNSTPPHDEPEPKGLIETIYSYLPSWGSDDAEKPVTEKVKPQSKKGAKVAADTGKETESWWDWVAAPFRSVNNSVSGAVKDSLSFLSSEFMKFAAVAVVLLIVVLLVYSKMKKEVGA